MNRILVLDGSNVHNVGELQMHVGNWGLFGSQPGSDAPFSDAPSGEWPAGSGVEYLYSAGLWVGALVNGVPSVSTATYETEFRPTPSPTDIIYRSSEGARNGNRYPNPNADDDGDGMVDEDWRDGHDNDGDGMIDEDFAAISDQMFSCWYTDDQPSAIQAFPQHRPIHLSVRQESYQWADDDFDDAVAIDYTITYTGSPSVFVEDVYIGFFVDPDCGRREREDYYQDDASGYVQSDRICTDMGSTRIQFGYGFDADGDEGQTPGYIGAVLLHHTTDPTGQLAPRTVRISGYHNFSASSWFENGGRPTNDFERYEVLSSNTIERDDYIPRDQSFLIVVGPFSRLYPDEPIRFTVALAVGEGLNGLIENATRAALLFKGQYFDVDDDPDTGILGRETPVQGPANGVVIDACDPLYDDPINIGREVVWVNYDCEEEEQARLVCGYDESQEALYRTGIDGKEHLVRWWIPGATPSITASVDILPGTCPNPFNVTWLANFDGTGNDKRGGVITVAVAGGDGFDAADIDPSTVMLQGVSPLRWSIQDQTSPATSSCECPGRGPDGVDDLVLQFPRQALARELPFVTDRSTADLTLAGVMTDGTPFEGTDCVRVLNGKNGLGGPTRTAAVRTGLTAVTPNPFNPSTRISYSVATTSHVRLTVYDVSGALVATLLDGPATAGDHTITWEASAQSSGIYFVRMETGAVVETRKVVLLK